MTLDAKNAGDGYEVSHPPRPEFVDEAWWCHEEHHEAHDFLIGHITSMRARQSTRYANFNKLNSIYEWGFRAAYAWDSQEEAPLMEWSNAFNAAQNVVETVHAQVCRQTLIPMPITTGGGYSQRKRAKDLQKALEGTYDECRVEEIDSDVQMDALNCGAGFAKVFSEFGRVCIEFVPCDDLTVDDSEGRYRAPRSMYETKRMDRFKALELYGGTEAWLHGEQATRRERIMRCKVSDSKGTASREISHDQIDVHTAYHLPSGPDACDGRMVVCIDGCTLVDVRRDRKRFPFVKCIPRPRRRQFWGLSMMHDLAANQNEYERCTKKNQKAMQKVGGTHILAPRSAGVNPREITNDEGDFVEYDGNVPPREWTPNAVSSQQLQYTAEIPDTMMRTHGVSPMSAHNEVPAGLSQASGKALQVFKDAGDGRLKPYFKARDRFHVDLCQLIIEEARELVEGDNDYAVGYASKKALEKISWSKVLIDEQEFVLKIFPISALAQDPAAKFEQLQEMLNAGAITIEQFKRLFGLPDLEAENEIDSADTDIIDMNLDIIAMDGRYLSPEPFDNLGLAKMRAGKFYNLCRARKGIPEARLELLRNYIADCDALLQAAAPPPPPAPPPQPGMPAGPPMPPDAEMPIPPPMMPPEMPPQPMPMAS